MTITLLSLALLGMVVGFFAGLFGIGGGAILVPALSAYFLMQEVSPAVAAHMALATSMSCIIFNALLSIRTHQQHQAILWPVVRLMTPTVLLGSVLATFGVLHLAAASVALLFFVLMMLVGLRMLIGSQHADSPAATAVPTLSGNIAGLIIGAVSALIAIGGGSLSVPYMSWYGIRIQPGHWHRRCPGTAHRAGINGGVQLASQRHIHHNQHARTTTGADLLASHFDAHRRQCHHHAIGCPADPPPAGRDAEKGLCFGADAACLEHVPLIQLMSSGRHNNDFCDRPHSLSPCAQEIQQPRL